MQQQTRGQHPTPSLNAAGSDPIWHSSSIASVPLLVLTNHINIIPGARRVELYSSCFCLAVPAPVSSAPHFSMYSMSFSI